MSGRLRRLAAGAVGVLAVVTTCLAAPTAPLVVVSDDNYPPYIFRDGDGALKGFLVDLWALWSVRSGIPVDLVGGDWADAQAAIRAGKAAVIDTVFRTPEREKIYDFTGPYADIPVAIYVHKDIGGITDVNALRGLLVGIKAGDACFERLTDLGITDQELFPSYAAVIEGARQGRVKVFCLDEPPANYLLYRSGAHRDFRKAFGLYTGQFHRAVRKGDAATLALVEDGFAAIKPGELAALRDKWMGTPLDLAPLGRYLGAALAASIVAGALMAVWVVLSRREVRRRTAELDTERRMLRTLVDTLPDLVWLKDGEGIYLACNHEFELFFGAKESAIVGRTDHDFVPRELADFFRSKDKEAVAHDGPRANEEEVVYASDGRKVLLETVKTPMVDGAGKLIGVLGIGRDITERHRNDEMLRLSASVFASAGEGIVITDPAGHILAVNPAFTRITGYPEAEALGRNPRFLRSGRHEADFYAEMWQALAERGQWQGELWNRRRNGEIYPEWLTISSVRDASGAPTHYVAVFSDITAVKESQEALRFLAHHDSLTGLPNRALLRDRLEHALNRARRDQERVAVLFVDLDRFKQINDSFGHPVGDAVLERAAAAMAVQLRSSDTLSRVGGDEFIIVLEQDVSSTSVATVASKLVDLFATPFEVDGRELYVTASIGIGLYPDDGEDPDVLLKHADLAMYRAKEQGRNNYQYYEATLGARAKERMNLETTLRGAVSRGELALHYQPQIEIDSGRLAGVEVLARWTNPELGSVPPSQFIPVAKEMGIIGELGGWVLRQACRQMAVWRQEGFAVPRIAVNLSVGQIDNEHLVAEVATLLTEWDLHPSQLELEVTESMLLQQSKQALEVLEGLRELGVFLAVDDFGTGSSSLANLRRLPVRRLKIDTSLVRDIGRDPGDEAIARAIIALAHNLGLDVVAEGVERPDQSNFLLAVGCDVGQGYLYGHPMTAEDLRRRAGNLPVTAPA